MFLHLCSAQSASSFVKMSLFLRASASSMRVGTRRKRWIAFFSVSVALDYQEDQMQELRSGTGREAADKRDTAQKQGERTGSQVRRTPFPDGAGEVNILSSSNTGGRTPPADPVATLLEVYASHILRTKVYSPTVFGAYAALRTPGFSTSLNSFCHCHPLSSSSRATTF